jgi:hypothetical protein
VFATHIPRCFLYLSGWWLGTFFYFSIYWELSSQLTFIFFRGVETTNQLWVLQFIPHIKNLVSPQHRNQMFRFKDGAPPALGLPVEHLGVVQKGRGHHGATGDESGAEARRLGQAGLVLVGTDEQFANWKMAIEIVG